MNSYLVAGPNRFFAYKARKYDLAQRRKSRNRRFYREDLRRAEITRLIQLRFGCSSLPDWLVEDEPNNPLIFLVGQALNAKYENSSKATVEFSWWLSKFAPTIEQPDIVAKSLIKKMKPPFIMASNNAAGRLLKVTLAERDRLRLKTFAPIDISSDEFEELRKIRKRQRDRERIKAKRELSKSLSPKKILVGKPWLALGISKSTYYRNRNRTN